MYAYLTGQYNRRIHVALLHHLTVVCVCFNACFVLQLHDHSTVVTAQLKSRGNDTL